MPYNYYWQILYTIEQEKRIKVLEEQLTTGK